MTDTHEKIERRWILDQFEDATFEIDVVHRLNTQRLKMQSSDFANPFDLNSTRRGRDRPMGYDQPLPFG